MQTQTLQDATAHLKDALDASGEVMNNIATLADHSGERETVSMAAAAMRNLKDVVAAITATAGKVVEVARFNVADSHDELANAVDGSAVQKIALTPGELHQLMLAARMDGMDEQLGDQLPPVATRMKTVSEFEGLAEDITDRFTMQINHITNGGPF